MGFKTFVAIYLSIIVAVSTFVIVAAPRFQTQTETASANHFSVVWTGFKPTYSNAYPDYYIGINNLKDDSLKMYIQLKIENYENVSLYFMIDNYTEPSAGWFVGPQYFGLVAITDPIKTFTYSNLNRTKPTAIFEGSLHESVDLVVKAYYDASYTQFYSEDNFTANFHFIDVTASTWSKFDYYNFDDQTTQGWYASLHKWVTYRSWPCSITSGYGGLYRSFDLIGNYTEAYLVAPVYAYPTSVSISLDDVLSFQPDMPSGTTAWHQIAIPLPLNKVTKVSFSGVSYLDDVYILAK